MIKSIRLPGSARVALTVAAVALTVAACGGAQGAGGASNPDVTSASVSPAWQKVIDAAKKEGTVTLYSGQGTDQLQDLTDRFEKAYGVQVTVNRDVAANTEARLNVEHTSNKPTADVIAIGDGAFVAQQAKAGWWVKPTGPDFDAPAFNKAKYLNADGSFISSAGIYTIGWNTQYVPQGIKSYNDLLDPKLKGHVGVIDPAITPAVVDFYDYLKEQNGPQYIDKLAAQHPQIFNSVLPAGQALTSGQIWAAVAVQPLVDEKQAGAPVDFMVPKPAWGAGFYTAVLANAPHPNAAQLLANFMITSSGQEAIARKAASVLPNIKGAAATVDDVRLFDPSKLSSADVAQFRTEFKQKFQS